MTRATTTKPKTIYLQDGDFDGGKRPHFRVAGTQWQNQAIGVYRGDGVGVDGDKTGLFMFGTAVTIANDGLNHEERVRAGGNSFYRASVGDKVSFDGRTYTINEPGFGGGDNCNLDLSGPEWERHGSFNGPVYRVQVGTVTLDKEREFTRHYETASWWTKIRVEAGTYPVFLYKAEGYRRYVLALLNGVNSGSFFQSRLGASYGKAQRDEHIGEFEKHSIQFHNPSEFAEAVVRGTSYGVARPDKYATVDGWEAREYKAVLGEVGTKGEAGHRPVTIHTGHTLLGPGGSEFKWHTQT